MRRNIWRVTRQVASNMLVVFSGIAFYLALSNFNVVQSAFGKMMGIISPFVWGLVLAYLLDGGVRFFEQRVFKREDLRPLAVAVTCLISLLLVVLLLWIVLPQLAQSLMGLVNAVPTYMRGLTEWISNLAARYEIESDTLNTLLGSYESMVSQVTGMISRVLPQVLSYSVAIGSGVISAITALISSVYMLLSKKQLLRQLKKVIYGVLPLKAANKLLEICRDANEIFGGFIIGKLLDSFIIGVLCFICTSLFRFPYALLISVIVGVTNIIPFFGPFIGAVPCFLILLIVNPLNALEFLVFVLVLQQIDGNVIGPRILGNSTGLPALWVLVAIILGQGLFGVVGMIVGVPTFAVFYALFRSFINNCLTRRGIDENGDPLPEPQPEQPVDIVE